MGQLVEARYFKGNSIVEMAKIRLLTQPAMSLLMARLRPDLAEAGAGDLCSLTLHIFLLSASVSKTWSASVPGAGNVHDDNRSVLIFVYVATALLEGGGKVQGGWHPPDEVHYTMMGCSH
jgi:hypothetical protein